MTTLYKCDKYKGLLTHATDGSLIRFINGSYVAKTKAETDVLDKLKDVRKVNGTATKQSPTSKRTQSAKTTKTTKRTTATASTTNKTAGTTKKTPAK